MPNQLKSLLFGLAATGMACLAATPAAPPQPPTKGRGIPYRTLRFDSELSLGGGKPATMKVWVAPASLREETTRDGRTKVVLRNATASYWWTEGEQKGFRMRLMGGQWRPSQVPDALEVARALPSNLDPRRSTFVGRETVGGYRTLHYKYSWVDGAVKARHEGSVWVLENRLFPVRAVSRGFDGFFDITNRNIVFDEPPPEGIFEPPKGVIFRELRDFRTR